MKRDVIAPLVKLTVFLVVTAMATYVLAVTIANTTYGSTKSYRAQFTDASGLQKGDDVRIAGVRVGTVQGIKVVKHNVAEVKFSVTDDRPLPTSVLAKLRYRNLMGQRYLAVEPGPGNSNKMLKPDGVIPVDQTETAVDLTALFAGFEPLFRGLDPAQINKLSGEIIAVLQGEGGSLELLLGSVAELTNSLADRDQVIGNVVDNLTTVLTTVGNRSAELSNLIVQLQGLVSGLAQDRQSITSSIDGLNSLATSTADLLQGSREPLKRDIVELTGLVGKLNSKSNDVEYVISNLAPTVSDLIHATSYGSFLNFYLCSVSGTITLPGGVERHIDAVPGAGQARCSG